MSQREIDPTCVRLEEAENTSSHGSRQHDNHINTARVTNMTTVSVKLVSRTNHTLCPVTP
jgi:hypothetical protein